MAQLFYASVNGPFLTSNILSRLPSLEKRSVLGGKNGDHVIPAFYPTSCYMPPCSKGIPVYCTFFLFAVSSKRCNLVGDVQAGNG